VYMSAILNIYTWVYYGFGSCNFEHFHLDLLQFLDLQFWTFPLGFNTFLVCMCWQFWTFTLGFIIVLGGAILIFPLGFITFLVDCSFEHFYLDDHIFCDLQFSTFTLRFITFESLIFHACSFGTLIWVDLNIRLDHFECWYK